MTRSEYVDQLDPSGSNFGTARDWLDEDIEDMSGISAGPITFSECRGSGTRGGLDWKDKVTSVMNKHYTLYYVPEKIKYYEGNE